MNQNSPQHHPLFSLHWRNANMTFSELRSVQRDEPWMYRQVIGFIFLNTSNLPTIRHYTSFQNNLPNPIQNSQLNNWQFWYCCLSNHENLGCSERYIHFSDLHYNGIN